MTLDFDLIVENDLRRRGAPITHANKKIVAIHWLMLLSDGETIAEIRGFAHEFIKWTDKFR